MASEYRELEGGVERHKRAVMGDDPRSDTTEEQQKVVGKY